MISKLRPYRPMTGGRPLLDFEYQAGTWSYLTDDSELPRFSVVAGYCLRYASGGRILEVGCGEGLLPERLGPRNYSRFVGIDVSTSAVERAQRRHLPGATFIAAPAESFLPDERFDLIVFNEVLEYMDDPLSVARRYECFLTDGGRFVVSQFRSRDNARTRKIWKRLHGNYRRQAAASVATSRRLSWRIEILAPWPSARRDIRLLEACQPS